MRMSAGMADAVRRVAARYEEPVDVAEAKRGSGLIVRAPDGKLHLVTPEGDVLAERER